MEKEPENNLEQGANIGQATPEDSLREDLEAIRERTLKYIQKEKDAVQKGESPWGRFDSPLEYYDIYSDEGKTIKMADLIDTQYEKRLGKLKGMEIGGTGSQLFQDLNSKPRFEKSLGVTLLDHRAEELKKKDADNHHEVIEADVFSLGFVDKEGTFHPGFEKVIEWSKRNGKADFIIEYMSGPIDFRGTYLRVFLFALKRWYELLAEDGTMIVETPVNILKNIPQEIKDKLEQSNIEITSYRNQHMKIHRKEGSPDSLDGILVEWRHAKDSS